jgi:multiple sugar transport system substrate-binding protein
MIQREIIRVGINRRNFLTIMGAMGITVTLGSSWRAEAGQGKTAIRAWTMSGQRWEMAQKAVIPEFEARTNGQITVELIATPIAETPPKQAAALFAGSSEYDVLTLDYNQLPQVHQQLEPLTKFMEKDAVFVQDYKANVPANVSSLYVWKDTFYGIAVDSNTQLGFYRKDVFDELGLKPAKTWSEIPALAKTLTRDTPQGKQYGFTTEARRGTYLFLSWATIYWSSGGELWDEKFQPNINNELGMEALDIFKKTFQYAHPAAINAADDDNIQAMLSGAAVYSPMCWGNNAYTNPQLNQFAKVTGALVVPAGLGPKASPRPAMGGFGLVIPKGSRYKEAAWEFIKYITGPEAMKTYVHNTGQPARTDALKQYATLHPYYTALADSLPVAHQQPTLPETFAIYETVGTEFSEYLFDRKNLKQAFADAEKGMREIFRQSGYIQ